jgi:L-Ala-D/L-Glu epimerase
MKIKNIKIYKENLNLTRPYTIAFKTIDTVENGIITITDNKGITGWGAFNPSYEVIGEKLKDGLEALSEENTQWLLEKEIREIDTVIEEVQKKFSNSVSARTGLEIALYDLYTKRIGIPLVKFLGQKIHSMPTSITIGIKNVADTIEEAKEYVERGFKILKVKLGVSPEEDSERMIKLREHFKDIQIIVDANQGYTTQQLEDFYEHISALNIQLIEQPLPAGKEKEMRHLPDHIKKLVAADESLVSVKDAIGLAEAPKACGYFNIKLMKCGGISNAKKIAHTAFANNINLMWGCNDESIISITAALHSAFSCSNTKFIDLDGSFDLAKDVVKGGFILKNGIMSIPDAPGLGLELLNN